ncbi:MAG: RnfABCDGE type electron transport complex subunit B [Rhodoferax sp.]|nr:RnfABCDGE type electron transport complex subunit B [Rhodoferax sp.]
MNSNFKQVALILDALPQTQCTRCGYADCAAYAQAIAEGQAGINQCAPGGQQGVVRLAAITGLPEMPLNPEFGSEGPRFMFFVDEDWCIGCTLCLDACPVDAIVGSNKRMHTVLEAYCTGCARCLPVCPVDCIGQENASGSATGWDAWSQEQAETARQRYALKSYRRLSGEALRQKVPQTSDTEGHAAPAVQAHKSTVIATALARARAQYQSGTPR